ncbi:MAG TPA: hypothetical protein VEL11_15720, partial [Candidatus Bathyarchaeia archaeon]|nr:hypothetical protein [Candidatus Bathyarchaeia archaeon]
MVVDTIRTIKLLGKWSGNRIIGRRRPLIAVFSLTHYCNFYCPMCPFGTLIRLVRSRLQGETI